MRKVFKYLKPYTLSVILCLMLVAAQAVCDLSLPNLMSDIVNVGIQQGGIKNEVPEAISENGMTMLGFFMDDSEKELVENGYQHVLPQSTEADRYAKDYPIAKEEPIYVLSETDEETKAEMNKVYGKSAYSLMKTIEKLAEESGASLNVSDSEGVSNISMKDLYQAIPVLEQMPREALEVESGTESEMFEEQVGVTFTKLFYEELGLDTNKIRSAYVWSIGIKMLLVALGAGLAAVCVGLISSRVSAKVSRDMRLDVFSKVENFSSSEFDNFSTASLITRTTNDIQQVQMIVMFGLRMLAFPPIMGVGSIIFALEKSPSLSWIIALAVVIIFAALIALLIIVMPKFTALQKLTDKLNLVSRENLSGMLVIRAFGNEKREEERFDAANKELSNTFLFTQRSMALTMPLMTLVMNGASILIVWFGARAIESATMQVGDMMAFIQYAMQIIMSFLIIAMIFVFLPRAAVSAKRIAEVIDTKQLIKDPENPENLEDVKGVVEFKNVSFQYKDAEEKVLENINFTAKPGETTAFIGSTGSGKSTLINLIPRFYDVTEGSVEIDGKDVRNLSQHDVRNQIGFVPQKGLLFTGTIESNIKYGKEDASEDEINKAIEIAQAKDFVDESEKGTETYISQGGTNVSGGQRQRLSIARALVKDAPIYIFDDSFSALDFKTDASLRKALKENTEDATVLIVAQRVSTIMNAEQIIVLDKGKMVGKGTHKELLENCPEYKEIAESQLQKEELA